MGQNSERLEHMFAPLDSVDLVSLRAVAETLRASKDKNKRAIGIFLFRVISYRTTQPVEREQEARPKNLGDFSGLRDLR